MLALFIAAMIVVELAAIAGFVWLNHKLNRELATVCQVINHNARVQMGPSLWRTDEERAFDSIFDEADSAHVPEETMDAIILKLVDPTK